MIVFSWMLYGYHLFIYKSFPTFQLLFTFLENFLQCYMYLQQIRFKTKLLIITPLF